MRQVKYECFKELVLTNWDYVHTHEKVDVFGHDGEVYEYRCSSCKRATIYLTSEEQKTLERGRILWLEKFLKR